MAPQLEIKWHYRKTNRKLANTREKLSKGEKMANAQKKKATKHKTRKENKQ